jgi:SecD/SecF fusion protein
VLFRGGLPQAPGTPISFVVRRINFSLACRSPKVLFPLTVSQLFYLLLFPAFCFPLSARAKAVPPSVPAVSVRMVHPDSQELDRERSPVPEGYTPYTYEFRGRHGKMQRERLFLKNTPIITESEVEQARIEPERRECLHITLNTQGGKTMKAATSAMNLGRDRLALVVQGKIKSAPVVQAVISRTFEISGLDGKNEASGLAELLNRQAPTEKNPPFISQDLALYAVHPESRRLVEEGVLRVPGFRLWKLPAHRQEKTGEEEYLFLGNSPIISGDCARHAEPDMEHPGSLDITWNEEAFRKLERASAGLRPGKDRIAVVLRGTILSTPLFQGMPSRTTLIPGLGDDSRLDALCRAINNTLLPLTEQQKRHVRENVALYPIHPRSRELEQHFLPELLQGKSIRLKSGFRSIPYTCPDFPNPVRTYVFIRPESLIGPEDIQEVERDQDGTISCQLLPGAWEKALAFMKANPAGQVEAAVVFRGNMRLRFEIKRFSLQLWGMPVLDSIQPNSFIYLLEPEEEQRMYRESFHLAIYGFLEPVCPWFFKSSPVFRAWGSRRPFLMIDSSLKGP